MLFEAAADSGGSSRSAEGVSDPSVIEQPPSTMAINAVAADAREPSRKALAKTSETGLAIMEECSRAYAVLVACRAAKCIDQILLLAMAPCWVRRAWIFFVAPKQSPQEPSPKNNDAGAKARVIGFKSSKSADQRDPRSPEPGPPRPPPGPPRSAPGPAPNTGFGFIGNRPSRCNFLRASLRARRTASAFSRAFFSEGFS